MFERLLLDNDPVLDIIRTSVAVPTAATAREFTLPYRYTPLRVPKKRNLIDEQEQAPPWQENAQQPDQVGEGEGNAP